MNQNLQEIIKINVGGHIKSTLKSTLTYINDSKFNEWFIERSTVPLPVDDSGIYFIDRDPSSFTIILNYLRLKTAGQLWEACLPKDPDRLALLTQEAEYFRLNQLRDQAIALLQCCTEKSDVSYVNEVLAKSFSCPQGFDKKCCHKT